MSFFYLVLTDDAVMLLLLSCCELVLIQNLLGLAHLAVSACRAFPFELAFSRLPLLFFCTSYRLLFVSYLLPSKPLMLVRILSRIKLIKAASRAEKAPTSRHPLRSAAVAPGNRVLACHVPIHEKLYMHKNSMLIIT